MSNADPGRLVCSRCGASGAADRLSGLCGCGGTLLYEPDLGRARQLEVESLARPGDRVVLLATGGAAAGVDCPEGLI